MIHVIMLFGTFDKTISYIFIPHINSFIVIKLSLQESITKCVKPMYL